MALAQKMREPSVPVEFGKASELPAGDRVAFSLLHRKIRALLSYFYRVPYFVPFWNRKTYRALAKCLLSGTLISGPELDRLVTQLGQFFSGTGIIPCAKGRVAIELALRGLNVSDGAEVIIPSFCCPSVLQPVLAAGATPVFADVGEELNLTVDTVEGALSSRTRAIIVPHLFGNPVDIQPILELGRAKDIFVIDDAAQALGAQLHNQPLGTFGDAGIISFGNGKVCFGTGGGMLLAARTDLLERAQKIVLAQGSSAEGLRNALAILLWRRWRRWSLPLQILLARFRHKHKNKEEWPGDGPPYLRGAMKNLDAAVALTLLDTLQENLRARRERVGLYQRLLTDVSGCNPVPHHAGSACLTQVVRIEPPHGAGPSADDILHRLRTGGYEVKGSYVPLHLMSQYSQFARGPLKHTERVWENLIELPCEPSVPLREIHRICALVHGVLGV